MHIAGSICTLVSPPPSQHRLFCGVLHSPWPIAVPYRRACRGRQRDRAANACMLRLRPDSGSPERVRPSQASLHLLACAHVFNKFWGYPGKTPNLTWPSAFPPSSIAINRAAFRPPRACDKASHLSISSPVRTFSISSGVIPAKRISNVTFCLPPRSSMATTHAAFRSPGA